jgi:hypothetical protein
MESRKIGKRMSRALCVLGPDFTTRTIDGETCIYRDLGNGFDVEVSGISTSNGKRKVCNFVCVWDVRKGKGYAARSTAYIREPATLNDLKVVLDRVVQVYGTEVPPEDYRDVTALEWLVNV